MSAGEQPKTRDVAAAFLVAGALILFQVSCTRLISYKLFYHFVFFAISLLGLGAAMYLGHPTYGFVVVLVALSYVTGAMTARTD